MTSPIRWGIIGCGAVTEKKSGPAFRLLPDSRLVAVMRRDASKAEDYARRHGVPKWTTEADQVIEDPEVDAVYIATPPGSHCDYALRVCSAGKPCYVEKPMARNASECREMIAAFERAGLPLFVAYYRRGLARFWEARAIVESGELGTITTVLYHYAAPGHRNLDPENLPWRLVAPESGGGRFLDMASHALDILDFIFGPLNAVSGWAANRASPCQVEDVVQGSFEIPCGAPGSASWNFASDQNIDRIEIEGTKGKLSLSCFGDEALSLSQGGDVREIVRPNPEVIQQPLIETIVHSLLGKGACPSTGESALRTSEVMDAMLKDYYGGRSDAFWERPDSWPGRPRLRPSNG